MMHPQLQASHLSAGSHAGGAASLRGSCPSAPAPCGACASGTSRPASPLARRLGGSAATGGRSSPGALARRSPGASSQGSPGRRRPPSSGPGAPLGCLPGSTGSQGPAVRALGSQAGGSGAPQEASLQPAQPCLTAAAIAASVEAAAASAAAAAEQRRRCARAAAGAAACGHGRASVERVAASSSTPPEGDSGGTAARGSGSTGSGAAEHAGSGSASGGSFRWAGQRDSGGASAAGKLYRVAYTFQGMEEDSSQLSLNAGDLVRVQCRDPSGWTYGRLECASGVGASSARRAVGDAGWFPEALLEGDSVEGVSADEGSGPRMQPAEDTPGSATGLLGGLGGLTVCREGAQEDLLSEPTATPTVFTQGHSPATADSSLFGFGCDDALEPALSAPGEAARLQECEQKLAQSATVRRRTQAAWETAQISSAEAEQAVETAERVLASLETQERRCRAEAIAVAGSSSQSLKSNWEAKLQLLEQKKEVVSATLFAARDRLEVEKGAADAAKTRLRSEKQAAAAALEAVSRQRGRAKASLQGGPASPGSSATAPASPPATSSRAGGAGSIAVSPGRTGAAFGRGASAAHHRPGGRATSPPRRPLGGGGCTVGAASRAEATSPPERPSGTRSGARSHSPNGQPRDQRVGGARTPMAPSAYRGASGAPGSAATPLRNRPTAPTRPDSRARTRPLSQSPGPHGSGGRGQARDAAPVPAQDEVACALEALQAAEALQAKLSAMPAHLREPVMRHCEALRGLLGQQTREALGAQTRDILAAPIPGAP